MTTWRDDSWGRITTGMTALSPNQIWRVLSQFSIVLLQHCRTHNRQLKKVKNRCSRTSNIILLLHVFFFIVKTRKLHFPKCYSWQPSQRFRCVASNVAIKTSSRSLWRHFNKSLDNFFPLICSSTPQNGVPYWRNTLHLWPPVGLKGVFCGGHLFMFDRGFTTVFCSEPVPQKIGI